MCYVVIGANVIFCVAVPFCALFPYRLVVPAADRLGPCGNSIVFTLLHALVVGNGCFHFLG